ncbi:iron ABC transporter substrate-binding protein [Thalassospira sp. HJ]|uniref:ABC transporter substrate-binding protein n=1 Tax=Thalassospira sp. HJ TaxID=1616823 RepID=UPI0005CE86A7|nr:ABC transporter substrate-binding protein [Thalassospira sp. HJ]KJE34203.1 iron ABC transporter substrate-binding protein [Thalassospira sp. HJ]
MKLFAKIASAAIGVMGAIALFGASQAQADIEITDVEGRTITLEKPAERVMLGFNFEDFLAIAGDGALDRVVAISRPVWKGWRPKQYEAYVAKFPEIDQLTDVGDTEGGTFSIEAAIAARPDLAIMAAWQYRALGQNVAQIEQAGIPVLVIDYNAQTLERHLASTRALGKAMGTEDRAEKLAGLYQSYYSDTLARVEASKAARKKVYVELAKKGPSEIGNSYANGMWGGLIDTLGGDNIANGQIENWGPLNPEYVLASKPDVVFLAGSEWLGSPGAVPVGFGADPDLVNERMAAYLTRPGWAELPAVKDGEIYALYHGGARTLSDFVYMRMVAKALYPDSFADVHPRKELETFYADWLPVDPDGVFVARYVPVGQ